jgi:HEAT repeat protein
VNSWVAATLIKLGVAPILDSVVNAIKSNEKYITQWAAITLCRAGTEHTIDGLREVLKNKNKEVRLYAVAALCKIGTQRAVEGLLEALRDKNAEIRCVAAEALGEIRAEQAIQNLLGALKDKVAKVRLFAAYALGMIGSQQAINGLLEASNDENIQVRLRAGLALKLVGVEPSLNNLLEALNDKSNYVRVCAITILGTIGSEQAVGGLLEALNDKDADIRSRAAMALGDISSEQAVGGLLEALNDEDVYVRLWAADALGQIGSKQAIIGLLDALNEENDDDAPLLTAQALAEFPKDVLEEQLVNAFTAKKVSIRLKAVQIISYYSEKPQTLVKLSDLARQEPDDNVRNAAKEATEKLARKLELMGHIISESKAEALSDNESRELFLVGEAFKIVAEAGHIFRPTPNSDKGIDGEIEFKSNNGKASGKRVYLQLKSGDSYLRKRERDGKEIFTIKPRHAEYWQLHAYPVLLVIRDSSGQIRWMNVTEYLKRQGTNIKQIEFQGESFTADSVKQMPTRFAC